MLKTQLQEQENELYSRLKIPQACVPEPLKWQNLRTRAVHLLEDRTYNIPQNIFVIKLDQGHAVLGRKLCSVLNRAGEISAINCSRISASMLLGEPVRDLSSGTTVRVEYYPLTPGEKLSLFCGIRIDRSLEIRFPYHYADFQSGLEKVSPPDGWKLRREKIAALAAGERHIRQFNRRFFRRIMHGKEVVYDPACSTGGFLKDFKDAFPGIHTIGHDLSREMVDYARDFVDECCCCNALQSPLPASSVDILFLRFLNEEVVSRADAKQLLDILVPKVKPGGWVVCFGHTPVLLGREDFIRAGLSMEVSNGYDQESDSIFQYYAMKRGSAS